MGKTMGEEERTVKRWGNAKGGSWEGGLRI